MGRDIILKNVSEEFANYIEENGFAEICMRGVKNRFKDFEPFLVEFVEENGKDILKDGVKSLLQRAPEVNEKALNQLVGLVGKKLMNVAAPEFGKLFQMNEAILQSVKLASRLNWISIGLSVANLCVNIYGFEKLSGKLDEVSRNLSQVQETLNKMATADEIAQLKVFDKVISRYSYMLDQEKIGKPFSEENLYNLVNDIYHTMDQLRSLFVKDAFNNNPALLDAIFTLVPLFEQTIIRYDRVYYFANKDAIKAGSKFSNEHNKWMNLFDDIYSDRFLGRIRDYCMLDKRMSMRESTQAAALSFYATASAKQEVLDSMELLLQSDTVEEYYYLLSLMDQYAEEKFEEKVLSSTEEMNQEEMKAMLGEVFEKYEQMQSYAMA